MSCGVFLETMSFCSPKSSLFADLVGALLLFVWQLMKRRCVLVWVCGANDTGTCGQLHFKYMVFFESLWLDCPYNFYIIGKVVHIHHTLGQRHHVFFSLTAAFNNVVSKDGHFNVVVRTLIDFTLLSQPLWNKLLKSLFSSFSFVFIFLLLAEP